MGIILRLNKGSELTFAEVDGNFQSLFYSGSLIGTDLVFYYPSSSVSQSFDLSRLPGFSGSAIYNGSTLVSDGVGSFYFTGSAVTNIVTTGSNGVVITLDGGDSTLNTGSFYISSSVNSNTITFHQGDGSTESVTVATGSAEGDNLIVGVKNDHSFTISKGTLLHAVGVTGENIDAVTASSDNSSLMPAFGIANADINAGAAGEAVISGRIIGVNTSGFTAGNNVYVGENGALTGTKPTGSSNLIQNFAIVGKVNATEGELVVIGSGRSNDVPNIQPGYFWVGNSDGVATAVATSSLGGSGIFEQSASSDVYFTTSSLKITGSEILQSPVTGVNPTASNAGTEGGVDKYAVVVSESVWHYTDNVGVPTSNPWKSGLDGSYFNNFDHNTDTAEILRFVAGLLSSSAPDATPNTRTWSNTNFGFQTGTTTTKSNYMIGVLGGSLTYRNARLSHDWDDSNSINIANTQSYRDLQTYLIGKGWLLSNETGSQALHDVGTHPFGTADYGDNIPNTIRNQYTSFTFDADSVAAGSTVFSSSIGAQAFGMGTLINATTVRPYSMSIYLTQSFSNTASITVPDQNSTFSTTSFIEYTIDTEDLDGDSNGLFLGIIPTNNPQIQDTYQDGKFLNVDPGYSGRKWSNTDSDGTVGNTTESIGYYRFHQVAAGLKTGSQSSYIYTINAGNASGYYMPSLSTLGATNITQNDPTITSTNTLNRTLFSATSRSLSGAPYILTTLYNFDYLTEVSKSFDPCYGYSTTPIATSTPTDQWETIGSTTLSNTSVTVNTNGVQTSTVNAGVFAAGSNPSSRRSINDIPNISDVSFLSTSLSFSLDSNYDNTVQNKSTQESTNYDLTFRTTGRNWKNSATNTTTTAEEFYDSTLFGQSSDSGSMAIYSRAQGYDNGSLTGLSENFRGETYRIKIEDDLLSGSYASGSHFVTASFDTSSLGALDLQVKPKYLSRPGGSYGYWIEDPDDSKDYKFYARAFKRNSASGATSMTLDIGKTLNAWSSTSDGVSAALIFRSSGVEEYDNPRIYDPSQLTSNLITATQSNDDHQNPFNDSLALYGNTGGSLNSTSYTIPLRSADGMKLDGSLQDLIVIIRYKGDPTPVTSISITFS